LRTGHDTVLCLSNPGQNCLNLAEVKELLRWNRSEESQHGLENFVRLTFRHLGRISEDAVHTRWRVRQVQRNELYASLLRLRDFLSDGDGVGVTKMTDVCSEKSILSFPSTQGLCTELWIKTDTGANKSDGSILLTSKRNRPRSNWGESESWRMDELLGNKSAL
jgi:hypothetical protein